MRDCNLPWSETNSIESFHAKLNNYGVPIRKNDYRKELPSDLNAKCLRIRMSVVDSQHCRGPIVNVTVPLSVEDTHQVVS